MIDTTIGSFLDFPLEDTVNSFNPATFRSLPSIDVYEENNKARQDYTDSSSRYINWELINQGATKQIYKAFDCVTERIVAIAVPKRKVPSEREIYSFIHEAKLTAKLSHPHIIPVYDIGFDERDVPFFTMKFCPGVNLSQLVKILKADVKKYSQKYNQKRLLKIFRSICEAVDYAHRRGTIHLDLKPANIIIGNSGEVFVCDWGMGKTQSTAQEAPTLTGRKFSLTDTAELMKIPVIDREDGTVREQVLKTKIKGTPGYMAPEQASIEHKVKGKRTDVYALGAILYNLITLEKTISGSNLDEILNKTKQGSIIDPRLVAPKRKIPRRLAGIAMKALSVNVADRFNSIKELIDDINHFESGGFRHILNTFTSSISKRLSLLTRKK